MNPLISVIIPVYNVEQYVAKCLSSITLQSYSNLEIIIVDDGSTDSSGKICDDYEKQDTRIRVIHKENGGQGSARNMALDIAKGEYICFLDSDDSVKEDYIEFLYNQLIKYNLDVSVCNYELFDENGNFLKKRKEGNGYIELSGIDAIKSMWTQGIINIGPWVKLYKQELWKDVRFKECFSEDWATMHYVFEKADRVGYSYECKLNYLVRSGSSIRSFQKKKLVMLQIADDNIAFAKKHPELLSASMQKAVSVYFHLLFQLPDDDSSIEIANEIKQKIKVLRPIVLCDSECIKKTRIALFLSYFGFGLTKKVFLSAKKKDVTI